MNSIVGGECGFEPNRYSVNMADAANITGITLGGTMVKARGTVSPPPKRNSYWQLTATSTVSGSTFPDQTKEWPLVEELRTFTGAFYACSLSGITQSVFCRVGWYSAASMLITTMNGSSVVLPASGLWVPVYVTGVAPAGTVKAITQLITAPANIGDMYGLGGITIVAGARSGPDES